MKSVFHIFLGFSLLFSLVISGCDNSDVEDECIPCQGKRTLTVETLGAGSGTVSGDPAGIDCGDDCSEIYDAGTVITLTAAADQGSAFAGWSGACLNMDETCTVALDEDQDVIATFDEIPAETTEYLLTVEKDGAGSGTVSAIPAGIDCGDDCSETYEEGTVTTLTATADEGSEFAGWSGACTGTEACVITADQAQTVTAAFDEIPVVTPEYALTVEKSGAGSGTVSGDPVGIDCGDGCSETYEEGTVITLAAAADEGSEFAGWSGACTGTDTCIVTMTEAQNVSAVFETVATGFAASDLQGTWYGYFAETNTETGDKYWFYGTLNADDTGNITGGNYTASGGSAGTYTGGQLSLDDNGILTGTLASSDGTAITIRDGKMDQGRTFGSFVSDSDDGTLDVGMLVKGGGDFSAGDLEGTWYGYFSETDPATGASYWFYGTLFADNAGNITGGDYTASGGAAGTYTGGQLNLDADGILTGTLATSDGTSVTIRNGKMDQSKTFGSFVSDSDDGTLDAGLLIKSGEAFAPVEMEGTWHGYFLETDPATGARYWFYATLNTDNAGNITGGNYTASAGAAGDYTGGQLILDGGGFLTGTVISSDGTTISIRNGKMNQSKTFGSFVSDSDDGTLDFGVLIKAP
ncbi:hypothetical protein QUF80_06585 [Desulfococcaceae bacterium HSG8]|nr:hypothetical protein [Desulfococcaceae bacterium HSG8]